MSLLLLGSHFHDKLKPFLCLIMIELNEDDSLLGACDAFRLPLSHPGFNPLSQELWQPFVQGHLNFPEKSGDLSGGIRTRLVPSPVWGCALWLVCLSLLPPHFSSECVCVGLEGWRERKRRNAREGWIDYRKMPNRLVLCPLPLVKLSIKTNDLLTVPFLPFLCWFSRLRKAGLIGGQLFYVRCTPSSYGSVQSGKWPVTLVTPSSRGGRGLPDSVFLWNDFFRSSSV